MKRFFIIPLFFLLLSGCESDTIEGASSSNDELTETQFNKQDAQYSKTKLNGLGYNIDSVSNAAITMYNSLRISEICEKIVENLIRKNTKLEYSNDLEDVNCFYFTQETWDSLKYYNYTKEDVSSTNKKVEIYVSGKSPYISSGLYENITVNIKDMEKLHPKLYEKGIAEFFRTKKPKVFELNIDNQSSNKIEYSAKIKFTDGADEYIIFSVSNEGQKIVVRLANASLE